MAYLAYTLLAPVFIFMKFDNKLQEDVFNYFNSRDDFNFHGYTGTFFFRTWEKEKDKYQIDSKKPHGDKGSISATICIYSNRYPENEKYGVEMKIEMYMWGYQSEETVFQGWVENIDQLKIICNAVGL
jgi:hypothetical protein